MKASKSFYVLMGLLAIISNPCLANEESGSLANHETPGVSNPYLLNDQPPLEVAGAGGEVAGVSPSSLGPNECNITGGAYACSVVRGAAVENTSTYHGVRSDPGNAVGAIDVWGHCRYVNNTSSGSATRSVFVPFKTAQEWQSFYTNGPSANSLNLAHCSKPQAGLTATASVNCVGASAPTPASVTQPNYHSCTPNGTGGCIGAPTWTQTPSQTFTCTPPAPGAPWTETATATFPGLDSEISASSWGPPISTVYTATPAACGTASGSAAAVAPTTGLCNAGSFSGFTGASPWTWTCITSGTLPSRIANCSTGGVAAVDPCEADPFSCMEIDPCLIDPSSCVVAEIDPCVVNPLSCYEAESPIVLVDPEGPGGLEVPDIILVTPDEPTVVMPDEPTVTPETGGGIACCSYPPNNPPTEVITYNPPGDDLPTNNPPPDDNPPTPDLLGVAGVLVGGSFNLETGVVECYSPEGCEYHYYNQDTNETFTGIAYDGTHPEDMVGSGIACVISGQC
ncbi:MAG: hypothetical protein WAO98_05625 [Alphaproteobacteria bacterium]